MKDQILILRGVDSIDLASLGLEFAKKYASANLIISVGENGRCRILKSSKPMELEYIDVRDLYN